ncbi:hypothetical protein H4582DRAFT_280030 [Lactarius indigo]|nr:hypothetical protein H4582DRAFT_280030 [Lactarius indigo]
MDYLQRSKPEIGIMSDSWTDNMESPKTDTNSMAVAMLSEQLHTLQPPASVPLLSHTRGSTSSTKEMADYHASSDQSRDVITESETSIDESSSISRVSDINNTIFAHDKPGGSDVQQEFSHTRDSDDLYSQLSLASFSFGAPTTAYDTDTDSTIPIQALSESGHSDSSGGENETRAEMHAIGNGRRRHSLPANWHPIVRPGSDVSETGSHARAAIRRNSIATYTASTRDRSFHMSDPDLVPTRSNAPRRPHYNDNKGPSVTVTSSNRDDLVGHVFQGIDLDYIFNVGGQDDPDTRRSSLSFIASQSLPSKDKRKAKKNKEIGKGEDSDADNDSFLPKNSWADSDYALRRNEWTFVRDREPVSLPSREPNGGPRVWDIWRCSQIGKIRVERATLPSSGANQQRLNAEHDIDPNSANAIGGPTTVIHRDTEALAFSIDRRYSLSNSTVTLSTQTPGSNEITSSALVIPTHDGILLTTKRVQEQFTIAKSTKKLEIHGISPADGDDHDTRREPNPLDLSSIKTSASYAPTPKNVSSTASLMPFPESPPTSKGKLAPHDRAEEGSDNKSMIRMARADALAALDKRATDRLKNEQVPAQATKRSHSWFRRFISPPGGRTPPTHVFNLDHSDPPWMTLAPRSAKEEQSRAIADLELSFKDVGLIPSTRSKGDAGIGHESKGKNKDVLAQVPDDSLYMLLPLWPHETDPASAAPERSQLAPRVLDQEQNFYLLVYYVPFDRQREDKPVKKRSRFRLRKGERRNPTPLLDVRLGFKIVGRLVAHSDLKGSGIRLPVRGLSVTGPLEEAELGIPPASLRDVYPDNFVIGACIDGSGTAIEFFPEGLEKLGLCVPRTQPPVQLHAGPGMETAEPVDEDIVFQPLTAIGRAAVEVAWLGCMALTTFHDPQSQGSA